MTSSSRDWYLSRLENMGPQAGTKQKENFETALAYLEKYCERTGDKSKREVILQNLASIDFHKEVKVTDIRPGQVIDQYRFKTEREQALEKMLDRGRERNLERELDQERMVRLGDCFTRRGEPTQRLAVSGDGRERCAYTVTQTTQVLQCHTLAKIDTWSDRRTIRTDPTVVVKTKPGSAHVFISSSADPRNSEVTRHDQSKHHVSKFLCPTHEPRKATKIHSLNAETEKWEYRSGPEQRGGGIQYIVPKSQHLHFKPAQARTQIQSHR